MFEMRMLRLLYFWRETEIKEMGDGDLISLLDNRPNIDLLHCINLNYNAQHSYQ